MSQYLIPVSCSSAPAKGEFIVVGSSDYENDCKRWNKENLALAHSLKEDEVIALHMEEYDEEQLRTSLSGCDHRLIAVLMPEGAEIDFNLPERRDKLSFFFKNVNITMKFLCFPKELTFKSCKVNMKSVSVNSMYVENCSECTLELCDIGVLNITGNLVINVHDELSVSCINIDDEFPTINLNHSKLEVSEVNAPGVAPRVNMDEVRRKLIGDGLF